MPIRAVIFDMDGVLIDAKEWHYCALNKSLALFGLQINRYDHVNTFDGLPTKKKLELLSLEKGLPLKLHPFINQMKQQYTLEMAYQECKPTFHHQYALSHLKQQGYRIAVCSNSIRNTVSLMLEKAHIAPYLDFFLSNEDVAHPKPHPEIYLKAMEMLGVSPQESLIVEDNIHGINAAKASKGHLLQVQTPDDVTLKTICQRIAEIEASAPVCEITSFARA